LVTKFKNCLTTALAGRSEALKFRGPEIESRSQECKFFPPFILLCCRDKDISLDFLFMGPCILVYNDNINNGRDAALYALYLMVMLYMFRASLAHFQEFRKLYLQPGVVFNCSWFCLLFVTCCICVRFCGSWIGVRWLSSWWCALWVVASFTIYHQIKSIKSYISSVIYKIITFHWFKF